ncbi:MAG: hypothetical protein QOJ69_803 [Actinomycetota bacterium]|jgi:hypothetical protein|nr:hypothetical protein [Actinomycetota bacterium]MEA2843132.1 hypothetical protein [Actinomycetota bacterium]
MRKAVKLLILGGVVGGAVVAVKSLRSEETVDDMPVKAAKTAGLCALAGGVIGFVLDRRSKRRRSKKARFAAAMSRLPDLPRIDLPHIELPRIDLPHIDVPGLPNVSDLRKATKKARKSAAKAARKATKRASEAADAGREKLAS